MKSAANLILVSLSLVFLGCKKEERSASDGSAGGGSASEGAAAAAPAAPPVDGELVITAKVAEISGPFPANDIYNYAYVMRYEVNQVHKGIWADKDILVGHYNPRLAREEVKDDQDAKVGGNVKSFTVGDVHYMVLTPMEKVWTGALEDDFYKDKRPRQWALWVDKGN